MKYVVVVNKNKIPFICSNPEDILLNYMDEVIFSLPDGYDYGFVRYVDVELEKELSDDYPYKILRKAKKEEKKLYLDILKKEKDAASVFNDLVKKNLLEMRLIAVDYRYDQKKITFYFAAENRVDFRKLVRDLAAKYKRRIELRQIGVRDQAKLIDGYGICGRRQCCSSFIKEFFPIDTNLAKIQDLMINPEKISGNCGRLLCCLAYEKDFYEQERVKYPEIGSIYEDPVHGKGQVKSLNLFRKSIIVQFEDGKVEEIFYPGVENENEKK